MKNNEIPKPLDIIPRMSIQSPISPSLSMFNTNGNCI